MATKDQTVNDWAIEMATILVVGSFAWWTLGKCLSTRKKLQDCEAARAEETS